MISLARADGASKDILETVTHGVLATVFTVRRGGTVGAAARRPLLIPAAA